MSSILDRKIGNEQSHCGNKCILLKCVCMCVFSLGNGSLSAVCKIQEQKRGNLKKNEVRFCSFFFFFITQMIGMIGKLKAY